MAIPAAAPAAPDPAKPALPTGAGAGDLFAAMVDKSADEASPSERAAPAKAHAPASPRREPKLKDKEAAEAAEADSEATDGDDAEAPVAAETPAAMTSAAMTVAAAATVPPPPAQSTPPAVPPTTEAATSAPVLDPAPTMPERQAAPAVPLVAGGIDPSDFEGDQENEADGFDAAPSAQTPQAAPDLAPQTPPRGRLAKETLPGALSPAAPAPQPDAAAGAAPTAPSAPGPAAAPPPPPAPPTAVASETAAPPQLAVETETAEIEPPPTPGPGKPAPGRGAAAAKADGAGKSLAHAATPSENASPNALTTPSRTAPEGDPNETVGESVAEASAEPGEPAPQPDGLATEDAAEPPVQTAAGAPNASTPQPGAAPGQSSAAFTGTVSHLATQILRKLEGRASRFDVQLDPAGLGEVKVSVQIDARGRLSASMAFDRPESAEVLKARVGELRAALERSGFQLGDGALTFESGPEGGFAGRDPSGGDQTAAAWRGRAFGRVAEVADQADQALAAAQRSTALGGLDIRI